MTDQNKDLDQAEQLDELADTFDDAGRRELLKRIGKIGVAAVPTAIVLSSAPEAVSASIDSSGSGGGSF